MRPHHEGNPLPVATLCHQIDVVPVTANSRIELRSAQYASNWWMLIIPLNADNILIGGAGIKPVWLGF